MSDEISTVYNKVIKLLNEEFKNGIGLRGVELKNYSAQSLEFSSERIIKLIIEDLKKKYPYANIVHSKSYLIPDVLGTSKERMDQHIKVNDKYVLFQEDRAWIDKPFYVLKRAVVRCIMTTCGKQMHENVKFVFLGYCLDYKKEIVNTCDLSLGYGDKVNCYSLTGRSRGKKVSGKNVNWYETSYDKETIKDYIQTIYTILEEAIKNESGKKHTLFG